MTTIETQILSVHWLRRAARAEERRLQEWLDTLDHGEFFAAGVLVKRGYPEWMRGVRVEKAGRFSFAVVATDTRGH
jgi:ADP-ribosylglycohydrolase